MARERRADRLLGGSRIAFAFALLAAMVGSLVSFGGLGEAATGAQRAADAVREAVTPAREIRVVRRSAAQAQYTKEKVPICHRTQTGSVVIEVAEDLVQDHLAHGDEFPVDGACPRVAGLQGGGEEVAGPLAGARPSDDLPFTGAGLGLTVLVSLGLLTLGLLLRRAARVNY